MRVPPAHPSRDERAEAALDAAAPVSVVICTYAIERWDALVEAVASVQSQTRVPDQMILVIDHNPALLERARAEFPTLMVVPNLQRRGLSGARNTGVRFARGEIVAFLDDDARAHAGWLTELLDAYRDQNVIGTGGFVEPRWKSGRAAGWLPEEFYWTIGCSYRGLSSAGSAIRNPIGASMSFRRDAILRAGGFREGIGRVVAIPLGCEETEMSVRMANALPGTKIVHATSARVDHLVEPKRVRWRYFLARCWAEGRSKAIVARHVGASAGLASERTYVLRTLPRGVVTHLGRGMRGELSGFVRAGAIVVGLSVTVAGYLCGRAARTGASALEEQA